MFDNRHVRERTLVAFPAVPVVRRPAASGPLHSDNPVEVPEEYRMSDVDTELQPPVAAAKVVYLGPVAPHWEVRGTYGDRALIDAFRERVNARLLLLPPHDPQFRRNRERVNRDAERERIAIEWDLGYDEDEG
jgi:hypothetical protein